MAEDAAEGLGVREQHVAGEPVDSATPITETDLSTDGRGRRCG